MDFASFWEVIKSLPAEVVPVAFFLFVAVQLLKATGVVGQDTAAQIVVLIGSFLSGGGLDIGSFEEALVPAGVAFFASLFYWLWANWGSPFVTPGLSKLTGRLMAATSKSKK